MKALKNLVTVGLIAGIAATSAFSAPKQKTIKLGFNIPLTGDSPKVGESAKFAGEIIKNEISRKHDKEDFCFVGQASVRDKGRLVS